MQSTEQHPATPFADFMGLIGEGPVVPPLNTRVRRVVDRARHLASDPAPLLLRGECGVGKRFLAGLIHQWGPHARYPARLVRGSDAGTPHSPCGDGERLRPSESRGTWVFDEIGEFTLEQQGELLEHLAAHDARHRDGANSSFVKIVATTSRDLSTAVRKGAFREELLSLLMDEALYLPPLRERPEDIVGLAERMVAHFTRSYHRPAMALEDEAKLALVRYAWPGNIAELRNAVERVVLTMKGGGIGESDFRIPPVAECEGGLAGRFLSLDAMEKQHILRVIRATSTLEEAARILRVDITTLWRKRRRYGV